MGQRKESWIRARVTDDHVARVAELERATGLNTSQVLRVLIESARLEPRPMPVASVPVKKTEGGAVVHQAASTTLTVAQS